MFINYGDIDFFEYGALVDKESDTLFHILFNMPANDDMFIFADCYVDLSDDWIELKEIMRFCDSSIDCPELVALACIEYYGIEEFSSIYENHLLTREEVEERLEAYEIA